jgi:septal ring factor EnvC (AmiA/AmiB activator)
MRFNTVAVCAFLASLSTTSDQYYYYGEAFSLVGGIHRGGRRSNVPAVGHTKKIFGGQPSSIYQLYNDINPNNYEGNDGVIGSSDELLAAAAAAAEAEQAAAEQAAAQATRQQLELDIQQAQKEQSQLQQSIQEASQRRIEMEQKSQQANEALQDIIKKRPPSFPTGGIVAGTTAITAIVETRRRLEQRRSKIQEQLQQLENQTKEQQQLLQKQTKSNNLILVSTTII